MNGLFFKESSMEDSYIYHAFNASNSLIEKIVKYLKTSVKLDSSYFEEQYMQMKKNSISPLSMKVIQAFDEGKIELLYSKEMKIGISVPFIVRKNESGNIVATIFISSFSSFDKNDNLTIPVKQLYALMETSYVALQMQMNPMKIQRNTALMKLCSEIYLQMSMRILNRDYSLTLDKPLYDKVSYCLIRFFLDKVWEYPNKDLVKSYASSGLENIDNLDLGLLEDGYTNAQIKDINNLLMYVKTLSPRMTDLNTRYYIERYINTFHGSSIMSIDYLPYVFFVIINVILGSFLISQTALNDIIKNTKGINRFYMELAKTI